MKYSIGIPKALTTTLLLTFVLGSHALNSRGIRSEENRVGGDDEKRERLFVGQGGLPLFASPSLEGGEPLANLQAATPVSVSEERQGWSRVVVWGWVPSAGLTAEKPRLENGDLTIGRVPNGGISGSSSSGVPNENMNQPEIAIGSRDPKPTPESDQALVPDVDDFGKVITDVGKASKLSVSTRTEKGPGDHEIIGITIGLSDPRGRVVAFENRELVFTASLYAKRVLAGGQTRGRKIHETTFKLNDWKQGSYAANGICRLDLSELGVTDEDGDIGILVVRTTLPDGRFLFGRDYKVALKVTL